MKVLPAAAVTVAAGLSAVALTDAAMRGLGAGASVPWDLVSGSEEALRAVVLLHGLGYLVLVTVLVVYRIRIDGASRTMPWLRTVMAACYLFFGLQFTWAGIFAPRYEPPELIGIITTLAFIGLHLLSIPMGLLLLRQPNMKTPALLLASPIVVLPLLIGLSFSFSAWAHPAYLETVVNMGVALLGVAKASAHADRPNERPVPATRTAFPQG